MNYLHRFLRAHLCCGKVLRGYAQHMYSPPAPVYLWCYCWSPCGQPGSVTHSTDGDNSSHPTHHPALTLTLGVGITTALTPEMFNHHPASGRSKSWSQKEICPFPLARQLRLDAASRVPEQPASAPWLREAEVWPGAQGT